MIVDCARYRAGRHSTGPADLTDALAQARASADAFRCIGSYEPSPAELDR